MNLIIVESPTKAKTISKFLDRKYRVESSFGHIRDLPKSEMGIAIEENFTPKYIIPTKAKKTVSNLKALAAKSEEIIIASDEDREGEAIAWHLVQALKLDEKKIKRIVFHEIVKEAILVALKKPRQIDHNLVNAQQARRILDRLVGYELSPFLWKKVARGLSAGRVQSVATRLIVEREKEIKAFNTQEYWTLSADLNTEEKLLLENTNSFFTADLYKIKGKTFNKLAINQAEAETLQKLLNNAHYSVLKIDKKQVTKNPTAPFTTSTLQQSANRHLGFSAKQTMMVAQKLYEQGYITYMRTDSLNLSPKFLGEAADWIKKNLGADYASAGRVYKNKSKNAQEAHEAIRPTEVIATPDELENKLDKNQARLYKLIWQRAVASQMAAAKLASTAINVLATTESNSKKNKNLSDKYEFRATGQILLFPGYLKVWPEKTQEQELPLLKEGQSLNLLNLKNERHETNPPARYSDASLIKELEKHGIGRPSTYAPTIATIIARNYVERDEQKRLKPTAIAFIVIDLLISHFPKIVDYQFTAKLEDDLDEIALGQKIWQPVISEFYTDFHTNLENKYQEIKKNEIMPEETSTEICDKCGAPMIIKTGRYGKFLACSAFPECRNIKKFGGDSNPSKPEDAGLKDLQEKYAGEVCTKCGAPMAVKTGKYGPFLACSAYPKCKNIKNIAGPSDGKQVPCPICGTGQIIKKFSRRGAFWACSAYPDCKNAYWGEPTGKNCPDCSALLVKDKFGKTKCSNRECGHKE